MLSLLLQCALSQRDNHLHGHMQAHSMVFPRAIAPRQNAEFTIRNLIFNGEININHTFLYLQPAGREKARNKEGFNFKDKHVQRDIRALVYNAKRP